MANVHRRIERAIKGVAKKLKKGEIPFPPMAEEMSAAETEQFKRQLEDYRRHLQATQRAYATDRSRAGHKKRLRADEELTRLEEFFKELE